MKFKYLLLTSLLLLLAVTTSACTGAATAATSWPGLSVNSDTAYVAYNQHVYAIDVSSGDEKWRYPPKGEEDSKITFYAAPRLTADGQLIVGGYNKVLYSLNPDTGAENWTFTPAADNYIASAMTSEDSIFAPNADQNLYVLDLNGNQSWMYTTQGALWAEPTTDPDCTCVYLSSMDHEIYAIDAETGRLKWESVDLGGSLISSPVLSPEGVLYVGTFANEMLALNAIDGQIIWRFTTQDWVWGGPILQDDRLYFGDLSGTFYALDASTGAEMWKSQLEGRITATPLLVDETIYVPTESGNLYALNLSGATRWSKAVTDGNQPAKLNAPPVSAGELILVSAIAKDCLVYAFDPDGNQQCFFTPEKK